MGYDGSIKIDAKIATEEFSKGLSKLGGVAKTSLKAVTGLFAGVSAGITAFGGYSVKAGSEFEAQMSKVDAISGATGDDIKLLNDKAKQMGIDTKFSATEAGQAFEYMAMAGWKTDDMLDGVGGVMSLAAASGQDLATTSDIVTDAMTAFGLSAKESGHFSDVLASASTNANTNVALLGESFKYVAPVAGALKYSVEDVSVALGLMANSGIKGSEAGTALRTTLTNLAKPSDKMAGYMDALGISLKDSSGNVKPLSELMGDLRGSFANLTDAEKAEYAAGIAGKEGMSGLLAIVNASPEDYDKLTSAINNADGSAQNMADTMMNNLQGQLTLMKSSAEGFGLAVYDKMQVPLTNLAKFGVNSINTLTDSFNKGGVEGLIKAVGTMLGQVITGIIQFAPQFISLAINILSNIGTEIINNSSILLDSLNQVIQIVLDSITSAFPAFQPISDLIEFISSHFQDVVGVVSNGIDVIGQVISPLIETISSWFQSNWQSIIDTINFGIGAISAVLTPVSNIISWIIDSVLGKFSSVAVMVVGIAGAIATYNAVMAITKAITEGGTIATIAQTIAQKALNLAMSLNPIGWIIVAVGALVAAFIYLWNTSESFRNFWISLWDKIVEIVSSVVESIGNFFGGLWDGIKNIFSSVSDFFTGAFKSAVEGIKGAFNGIKGFFSSVWDGITGIFHNVGVAISDAIGGAVKGAINGILSNAVNLINGFISAINFAIEIINKLPGVNISSIGMLDIPQLARGGILRKGEVGLLEGNGSEAVVPLDQNEQWINAVAKSMISKMQGTVANFQGEIASNISANSVPYNTVSNQTTNNGGDTFNFYNPVETPQAHARALKRAKRELAYD